MADYTETEEASQRMTQAALALAKLAPEVAAAKQVREFHSDRHKRMLAVLVTEQLNKGVKSSTEAEFRARASDAYGQQLNDLGDQLRSAQRVIQEHEALIVQYEAARSVLSLEKAKIGL